MWRHSDPSSGLTYPALSGSRKQSVVDAERLFSPDLAAFMRGISVKPNTSKQCGTGEGHVMREDSASYSGASLIISF